MGTGDNEDGTSEVRAESAVAQRRCVGARDRGRSGAGTARHAGEGAGRGARGDAPAQTVIESLLRRVWPDDAVLSEEAVDDPARLSAERVWIVDPLDGTREYGEPGRIDWVAHVALWERGELTSATVAPPALGVTLGTDDFPSVPPASPHCRVAVSRTRPPSFIAQIVKRLDAVPTPMGSAGYKVAAVVRGEDDAELRLNDIGRRLRATQPVLCDSYRRNRDTGRFVLVDESPNRTVGAGMIN